jgi:mannitol/fructose-specific phosphotransferase system IIA component (Ntr-type)
MQAQAKDYWKLFKPSACCLDLRGGTKESVFEELVSNLVKARSLQAEHAGPALRAFLEREQVASTGVGQGVAIPHVKLKELDEAVFSLSLHASGVDWNSLDGGPVFILFTVLRPARQTPRHDPERHLDMMRWVAQIGRQVDFRNFARRVSKRTELVDLLKEMSTRVP